MKTAAIIVAAGSGSRMKAPVPKPFLELIERPLLLWSLQPFQASQLVDEIVIVVGEPDVDRAKALITFRDIHKVTAVVAGGATRQESVQNGLARLSPEVEIVLIHDGARPFVTPAIISSVIEGVLEKGAAVPVIAINDTIKQVNADGLIEKTIDRHPLRAAQTPQGFRVALLREAHVKAVENDFCGTDDACLVERLGHTIVPVDGNSENIKITTPDDMTRAESIAQRRLREAATTL